MKILIIGLIAFIAWSIPSTYWYVCKIKNLCPGQEVAVTLPVEKPVIEPEPKPEPEEALEEVEITNPGTINLYSEYNQADFLPSDDLNEYLKNLADYLKANPTKIISITGNTDSIGSQAFNMDLGLRRAENVKNYLMEHGLEETRITVRSDGKENPISDNGTEAGRAKNRRIEIKTLNY